MLESVGKYFTLKNYVLNPKWLILQICYTSILEKIIIGT